MQKTLIYQVKSTVLRFPTMKPIEKLICCRFGGVEDSSKDKRTVQVFCLEKGKVWMNLIIKEIRTEKELKDVLEMCYRILGHNDSELYGYDAWLKRLADGLQPYVL